MKIGILTYHRSCNFGANLQLTSTYHNLRNAGFDPVVIDYYPDSLKKCTEKGVSPTQIKVHYDYIDENFNLTRPCKTSADISEELKRLDIRHIIIGSDAVFNVVPFIRRFGYSKKTIISYSTPMDTLRFPNPFWGEGIVPHASADVLSASSQAAPYRFFDIFTRIKMRIALGAMKSIAVRDGWTKKMVEYLSFGKISPDITPDPVFAFTQSGADVPSKEDIAEKFDVIPGRYILLGFRPNSTPPKEWVEELSKKSSEKGLALVWLPMPAKIEGINYGKLSVLSPLEWYALIKYSFGYIGNNMHPIVIALHNVVPFFAFDQYYSFFSGDTGSKTLNIIKSAGFEHLRVSYGLRKKELLAPSDVLHKLEAFDVKKGLDFSIRQADSFMVRINGILSSFRNGESVL